jgi:HSP20 family protein
LFDSAFELTGPRAGRGWSPALDIHEDSERVIVSLEAAGLKKDDFEIALHDDNLTISGERKSESEQREGETVRRERFVGQFSRTVTLPAPVKGDAVTATYTDGVLTITLPKAEEARPRKIEVNVQ